MYGLCSFHQECIIKWDIIIHSWFHLSLYNLTIKVFMHVWHGNFWYSFYSIHHNRMDKLLGTSYISMAIAVALLTGGVTLAVEYLVPWRTDSMPVRKGKLLLCMRYVTTLVWWPLQVSPPDVALLAQKSWSPIYAGTCNGKPHDIVYVLLPYACTHTHVCAYLLATNMYMYNVVPLCAIVVCTCTL